MSSPRFDYRQYKLLLSMLRELGARQELTSQLGIDPAALKFMGIGWLVFGAILCIFVLSTPPAPDFMLLMVAVTAFVLIPIIVSEAADAFLHPAEMTVLAPRPVRSGSYVAAKLTYVLRAALGVALPLNALPAIAGLTLDDARWFSPLMHAAAVSCAAAFTSLATCGLLGAIFRLVPVASVRRAALGVQILTLAIFPVLPHIMRVARIEWNTGSPWWSAFPLSWFLWMGLIGHPGQPSIDWRFAMPAMLVALLSMTLGVRALSRNYMSHVGGIRRSLGRARRWRATNLAAALAARFTGHPAGRAAAAFVTTMMLRDWQFRRVFFQSHFGIVILLAIALAQDGASSPMDASTGLRSLRVLPHLLGLLAITTCQMMAFTDHYKGAWVFLTAPASNLHAFVKGVYWALWTIGIAVPHIVLLGSGLWLWGPHDAVMYTAYSAALATFYLGVAFGFTAGLPFVRPPDPSRPVSTVATVVAFMVLAGVVMTAETFLIFPDDGRVAAGALLFAGAAFAAAAMSLRIVQGRIQTSLERLVTPVPVMFGGSASS